MAVPRHDRPPAELGVADVALWRRLRGVLLERGDWQGAAPELLEALVRRLSDARMWREDIAGRERVEGAASRYTHGSRGQLVAHPSLDELRHAVGDAQTLAGALLLSPAAARRAGLTVAPSLEDEFAGLLGETP
jgi:hypothetical protein